MIYAFLGTPRGPHFSPPPPVLVESAAKGSSGLYESYTRDRHRSQKLFSRQLTRPRSLVILAWRLLISVSVLTGCGDGDSNELLPPGPLLAIEELGEALFFDTNISFNRKQACATCHSIDHGFIDNRLGDEGEISRVSIGTDENSLGTRNAPTTTYARFVPPFNPAGIRQRFNRQNQNRRYEGPLGGLFWDGRARDLAAQAKGPPLSPVEMGMPDISSIIDRVFENSGYVNAFTTHFGDAIFDDQDEFYNAFANSIAQYEQTDTFASFDSRYDRSLRGDIQLSFKELTGKAVFFSQFANCSICHLLHALGDPVGRFEETFTGYEYHNLGIPAHPEATKGLDSGLNQRKEIIAPDGLFRVPTLRNVAVTGPYMHNGIFRLLRTVVEYYDHFNNPKERQLNPETSRRWRAPEFPSDVTPILEVGDPLTDLQVESLVCFLRSLTDARYEHLIQENGNDCAD
ncbi:MAG: hypothetical protein KTR25_11910 [Myxococcales bacterium]|nr:hypothetical protein [Myxococcales bacterium]